MRKRERETEIERERGSGRVRQRGEREGGRRGSGSFTTLLRERKREIQRET